MHTHQEIDQGISMWRAVKPDRDYEEHATAMEFKGRVLRDPDQETLDEMIEMMGFSNIDWNVMRALSAAAKAGVPEAVSAVNQMAAMYGSQHTFTS